MYKPNLFLCCCFLLFASSAYSVCNFSTIKGDTDKNGVVDASDLFPIAQLYGLTSSSPNYDCEVDANEDGKIDASDLFPVAQNYAMRAGSGKIETCPTDSSCIKLANRLIGEIGDINRFENEAELADYCGVGCLIEYVKQQ